MNLDSLMRDLESVSGMEKVASAPEVVPNLKDELAGVLTKRAEQDLTKVAFAEGVKLAETLLNNLSNQIHTGNAVMEAQDDQKIVPTNGGTIEDVLKATVAQGVARGGTSEDRVDEIIDQTEKTAMTNPILAKIASSLDIPVVQSDAAANVAGAPVPNMIQMDNAAMTAQDDAKVQPTPGAEGTVNEILQAIVAQAQSTGAGSDNLAATVPATEGAVAPDAQAEKVAAMQYLTDNGYDFDTAVALVKEAEAQLYEDEDMQEKVAAVQYLTDAGYDFDSAVELVKQAEYELASESEDMEKAAAVDALMGEGYDFDSAVELVKVAVSGAAETAQMRAQLRNTVSNMQIPAGGHTGATVTSYNTLMSQKAAREAEASDTLFNRAKAKLVGAKDWTMAQGSAAGKAIGNYASGIPTDAGRLGSQIKAVAMGGGNSGYTRMDFAKALAKNRALHTLGAAGAIGAGVYAMNHEKQSAVDSLMAEGLDFDTAVQLVKEAADEKSLADKARGYMATAKGKAGDFGAYMKQDAAGAWEALKGVASGRGGNRAPINGGILPKGFGSRAAYAKDLIGTTTGKLGAGLAAAGIAGGAYTLAKRHSEKRAAFEALTANGVDFDTAVSLVDAADQEVYG